MIRLGNVSFLIMTDDSPMNNGFKSAAIQKVHNYTDRKWKKHKFIFFNCKKINFLTQKLSA